LIVFLQQQKNFHNDKTAFTDKNLNYIELESGSDRFQTQSQMSNIINQP